MWPMVTTLSVLVASILGTGVFAGQLWGVFVFGAAGATAAWSLSTLLPTLVARVAAADERGRVFGWIHLWWNVARIAGSLLGGALFDFWMGLPFLIAGVISLASIPLVFRFYRATQRADSDPGT
jgi:MFS family permease